MTRAPALGLVGLLLGLLAPAAARAQDEGALRSECRVEAGDGETFALTLLQTEWKGWPKFCERLALYLRSPEGKRFTPDERSRLLREYPGFERAECSAQEGGVVACAIVPGQIVYRVKIAGKIPFAVLVEDLRRRIFLRPGTVVKELEDTLERQRLRLESYLEKEGFFGSKVLLTTRRVPGAEPAKGLELEVRVEAGRPARLRKIELEGALPAEVDRKEVKKLFTHRTLGMWRDRFIPRRAEQDAEKLEELLKDHGYPEARVEVRWAVDQERHGADLTLELDAGPRVVVRFLGNRSLGTSTLEKKLTFREVGAADTVEAESSAEAMRKAYQERGYHGATVETQLTTPEEGTLWHSFEITEGERASVSAVDFEGNEVMSREQLLREVELKIQPPGLVTRSRLVDEVLAADRRAIERAYVARGYAAAEVKSRSELSPGGKIRVVHSIVEGPRRWVEAMTLEGLPPEIDPKALTEALGLRTGTPYVHSLLGPDRREIHVWLARAGYAGGVVKRDLERPSPSEGGPATLHYRVTPGPKSRFGGILVSGDFRTRVSLLEERLELDPGDDLDLLVLGASRRALLELGPFSTVDLEPLGSWREDGVTWLSVEVKERTATTLDLVLSASTDDGLAFGLDLRDRNLLGRAVRLEARARAGWIFGLIDPAFRVGNSDTADVLLSAPEPFGAPFDVQGTAFYNYREKATFQERRIGIAGGLSRLLLRQTRCKACPDLTAALRYGLSTNDYQSINEEGGNGEADFTNIGRLTPSLKADWRDSFLDPRGGGLLELRFELARPWLSPLSQGASFLRAMVSGQLYLGLGTPFAVDLGEEQVAGGPIVLAMGGRIGLGWPTGGTLTLPESEAFSYGGDASVRGLKLRISQAEGAWPVARSLLEGTVELRWYLLQNVGFGTVQLALFADAAAVSESPAPSFGPLTLTVGPALRYVTPVGPISLAYGYPAVLPAVLANRRPNPVPGEDPLPSLVNRGGRLHLTFGYTF
ncbi:MAG: POTRA domain-containing protein [Deltaproteobacteria bacterium]|nr:POTRA domain-containing protein [Deltaproteobacteria bacterium]